MGWEGEGAEDGGGGIGGGNNFTMLVLRVVDRVWREMEGAKPRR